MFVYAVKTFWQSVNFFFFLLIRRFITSFSFQLLLEKIIHTKKYNTGRRGYLIRWAHYANKNFHTLDVPAF